MRSLELRIVTVDAPVAGWYVPAGQARHRVWFPVPTVVEYVPTGQTVQLPTDTSP